MSSISKRLVAAFTGAALSLAAPAGARPQSEAPAAAQAERPPRPAIWLLADDDTKIYLFGTVHILMPGLKWRSRALDRVVAEADELVLEIDEEEMARDNPDLLATMHLGKEVPLHWRVSPDRRETLRRMLEENGIDADALAGLQTWAVTFAIAAAAIARAYSTDQDGDIQEAMASLSGVEEVLTRDFQARERPISGVETPEQQLSIFSSLSLPTQRALLEQMVDAYAAGDGADVLDPGEADWVSGNVEAMVAELDQLPPELHDALLTRRNAAWTGWLVERLERPGTVLFAVGAAHLAGRVSVQSMLAARGHRVSRVD